MNQFWFGQMIKFLVLRSATLVSERFELHSIVTTEQAHTLIAIAR
ncbi:MAG: hypothetical protein V7K35_06245 [Nostoc sp.]